MEDDHDHFKHSLKIISVYRFNQLLSVVFRINLETISVYFWFVKSLIFQIIKEIQDKL